MKENLFLLGDFNARIGAAHTSWPRCIGHFSIGKLNENGQRLFELCSFHDLAITNIFYPTKPHHRVSWQHPRSKHWHQLYLIITRRPILNHVLLTHSYHSADCDTDHSLVGSMVRLRPRRTQYSKKKGRPHIDTARASKPELRKCFAEAINKTLEDSPTDSTTARWDFIRDAIYQTASDTFGKRARKNEDWFEAGIEEMEPALASKGAVLLKYKEKTCEKTLAAYREIRNNAKRVARRCTNDY